MERLDALQAELNTLLDSLRRSGVALEAGLERLRAEVGVVGATAEPEPEPEPEPVAPAVAEPEPAATNGEPPADEAGARLIALNMALSGTPRDETARFLAEHYDLPNAEALLDDVYKRAGA
jgi:hypothetical protein